jgi:hypothetical protein
VEVVVATIVVLVEPVVGVVVDILLVLLLLFQVICIQDKLVLVAQLVLTLMARAARALTLSLLVSELTR